MLFLTQSVASLQNSEKEVAVTLACATADKPNCVFGQMYNLTGQWVKSSTPSFHGYYNATADCPDYAHDFDCQNPNLWGERYSIHQLLSLLSISGHCRHQL